LWKKKEEKKAEKKNTIAKSGTNVRVRGINAGLLARSQLHSEGLSSTSYCSLQI
jgi:hypothetical protein